MELNLRRSCEPSLHPQILYFFPLLAQVQRVRNSDPRRKSELFSALDALAGTDVPVILLPFGPLRGAAMEQALDRLIAMDRLIVVPAGNSGVPEDFPLASKTLVAESVNLDGSRSAFSSKVKGALGAVGELTNRRSDPRQAQRSSWERELRTREPRSPQSRWRVSLDSRR